MATILEFLTMVRTVCHALKIVKHVCKITAVRTVWLGILEQYVNIDVLRIIVLVYNVQGQILKILSVQNVETAITLAVMFANHAMTIAFKAVLGLTAILLLAFVDMDVETMAFGDVIVKMTVLGAEKMYAIGLLVVITDVQMDLT